MVSEMVSPIMKLVDVPGYPYPLPPGTQLKSKMPGICPIIMPRFNVIQWPQLLNDGKTTVIFQTLARNPSVLILPVSDAGLITLVKTKQPGRPEYDGFVAGDLEPDKDQNIFEAAKRELLEEIGHVARQFHVVYLHYFVPGWEWFAYTIIASGTRKAQEPAPDAGERNTPYEVDVDKLISMARKEQFLYPPVLVNKLLLRQEDDMLKNLFANPARFAAMSSPAL